MPSLQNRVLQNVSVLGQQQVSELIQPKLCGPEGIF